jgi:hypothetical protein
VLATWLSAGSVRFWPIEKSRFGAPEHCGFTVHGSGTFDVDCKPGNMATAAPYGIWRPHDNELWETLDSGLSFQRIIAPAGLDGESLECRAIGCFIGPYMRLGWGQ